MGGRPGVGGWERDGAFSRNSQSPSPSGISPQDPVHVPKDTHYTTCQVRVEGVPGRRSRQARSRSSPSFYAPKTPRPGESRGTPGGGKAAAQGRPAGRADRGGALTSLGGGAGGEWAEPRHLARRRQCRRQVGGRAADSSPPAAGCLHTHPGGRRGRGGGGSGSGGTFPHPGQRQRGAPPTARSGQLAHARRRGREEDGARVCAGVANAHRGEGGSRAWMGVGSARGGEGRVRAGVGRVGLGWLRQLAGAGFARALGPRPLELPPNRTKRVARWITTFRKITFLYGPS